MLLVQRNNFLFLFVTRSIRYRLPIEDKKIKKQYRMKRILFIASIFFSALNIQAESVSDIFKDFSYARNVEKVNLNRFVMSVIRPFISQKEFSGMKIKSLQVLDLSECDRHIKDEYDDRVRSIDDELYETLIQVKDDEEYVKVMAKNYNDHFNEIVVLVTGDDAAYIRIKGNFSLNDVQKFACNN